MYQEIGFSINAHIPLTSIQRHFPKHLRGFCKGALKGLVKLGLITKHPTSGSMTYSLTIEGINIIKQIVES
jgi:hypothetical protein